jgi:3'(2'), 5'-bisphosphate nucleotidase
MDSSIFQTYASIISAVRDCGRLALDCRRQVNDHPHSGWLDFSSGGGKRQKHASDLTVAVKTGSKAPGFKQPIQIVRKENNDISTDADLKIEAHILETIQTYFPFSHIISEETHHDEQHVNIDDFSDQYIWAVDPIDGTEEYLSKGSDYAVCVAQLNPRFGRFGCMLFPETSRLYLAHQRRGVYVDHRNCHPKQAKRNGPIRIGISSREWKSQESLRDFFASHPELEAFPSVSISCKIAQLIDGKIDAYLSRMFVKKEIHIWDIAPGIVFMNEWGYVIRDLKANPYDFSQTIFPLEDGLIIASESVYEQIWAMIEDGFAQD